MQLEGKALRFLDKSKWKHGPWTDEPDRFEFKSSGFDCLALRHPRSGHWCGYVGVPPGHPWHGLSYAHRYTDDGEIDVTKPVLPDIDAHGGVTFAEACQEDERPPEARVCHLADIGAPPLWWVGFDFMHAWDEAPARADDRESPFSIGRGSYKNLGYVTAEIEKVARQAKDAVEV